MTQVQTQPQIKSNAGSKDIFTLAPLPYDYAALEPVIDTETMKFHHDKHHQAYVTKLNEALLASERAVPDTLEALLSEISKWPDAVRNNAVGHWNHTFFWSVLTAPQKSGKPSPALGAAIDKAYGSFAKFTEAFQKKGETQFGSGWAWLVKTADGSLEVLSTPNQDSPLMDSAEQSGTPLLAADVWEHAYYLKYQNKRPDYLKAFWNVVNWEAVSLNFEGASNALKRH